CFMAVFGKAVARAGANGLDTRAVMTKYFNQIGHAPRVAAPPILGKRLDARSRGGEGTAGFRLYHHALIMP
ncbi:MAG: hypothetical protein CMO04_20065, partial [Thalassospira sp.]|nr:hypothetical protein [Thalassospira sp.]